MKNSFYNDFDIARKEESKRTSDYRSPFQIDRDRIIHSSEFRRLQGKTQVFLPGVYDFYRTRLTHSIEVAQIGRSITNFIKQKHPEYFSDDFFIDPDLVEAACLAHDLGHPPFGHAGERTLNSIMKCYGGFEGNAQTLRLLTEVFYRVGSVRRGMKPTRALIDSVLKYKSIFSDWKDPKNHFLYNYQKEYVNFIFDNKSIPTELKSCNDLNNFKSIECQIMDWADDTAYALNDIVDSIAGGFMTITRLVKWYDQNESSLNANKKKTFNELIEWIKKSNYKAKLGGRIGEFIQSCSIRKKDSFLDEITNRYNYELIVDNDAIEKTELYKKLSVDLVFRTPQLHQMEFKGDYMINQMFKVLEENYIKEDREVKLTEDFTDQLIRNEEDENKKARLICDYISGMTDGFATHTFKRLFDPDYSSLVDFG